MLIYGMKSLQDIVKELKKQEENNSREKEISIYRIKSENTETKLKARRIKREEGKEAYILFPDLDDLCADAENLLLDKQKEEAIKKAGEIYEIVKKYMSAKAALKEKKSTIDENIATKETMSPYIKEIIEKRGTMNEFIKINNFYFNFDTINNNIKQNYLNQFCMDNKVGDIVQYIVLANRFPLEDFSNISEFDVIKLNKEETKFAVVDKLFLNEDIEQIYNIGSCVKDYKNDVQNYNVYYRPRDLMDKCEKKLSYEEFLNIKITRDGKTFSIRELLNLNGGAVKRMKESNLDFEKYVSSLKKEGDEEGYNCCIIDKVDPKSESEGLIILRHVDDNDGAYYVFFEDFEPMCKESEKLLKEGKDEEALNKFKEIIDKFKEIHNAGEVKEFISSEKIKKNIDKSILYQDFYSNKWKINNLLFKVMDLYDADNIMEKFKKVNEINEKSEGQEKRTYYLACKSVDEANLLVKKDGTEDYMAVYMNNDMMNNCMEGRKSQSGYREKDKTYNGIEFMPNYSNILLGIKKVFNRMEKCGKPIKTTPKIIEKLSGLDVWEEKAFLNKLALFVELYSSEEPYDNSYGEAIGSITLYYKCIKEMTKAQVKCVADLVPLLNQDDGDEALQKLFEILEGKNDGVNLDGVAATGYNDYIKEKIRRIKKERQEGKVVNDEPGSEEPSAKRRKTE